MGSAEPELPGQREHRCRLPGGGGVSNYGSLAFGTQSALSTATVNVALTGGVQLQCTPGVTLNMTVDGGQYNNGGRNMQIASGTARVAYKLFRDAAYSQSLGIGQSVAVAYSDANNISLPIYGQVQLPGNQPGGRTAMCCRCSCRGDGAIQRPAGRRTRSSSMRLSVRGLRACSYLILAGLLSGAPGAWAASSVLIWPIDPVLEADQQASALWLENRGSETANLQIRVFAWSQSDFADQYQNQRDVIGSPPVAKIERAEATGALTRTRTLRRGRNWRTGSSSTRFLPHARHFPGGGQERGRHPFPDALFGAAVRLWRGAVEQGGYDPGQGP